MRDRRFDPSDERGLPPAAPHRFRPYLQHPHVAAVTHRPLDVLWRATGRLDALCKDCQRPDMVIVEAHGMLPLRFDWREAYGRRRGVEPVFLGLGGHLSLENLKRDFVDGKPAGRDITLDDSFAESPAGLQHHLRAIAIDRIEREQYASGSG
jgi:hypothetical protein